VKLKNPQIKTKLQSKKEKNYYGCCEHFDSKKTERKNYNEKKLQIWFTQTLIFKMVICIFCLFQFLKIF